MIGLNWLSELPQSDLDRTRLMDHTGDTRHPFNPDDVQALAEAEERFKKLTGLGFTAAVRTASGEVSKVRSFDPNAEETVFFPRLVGG
jgi:hypothetical protein